MWFQQVLIRHVTPFIFTVNSHNYRISMFNVTIHVHYNCQMWESSVISEIPTNPTKKTYLRLEARMKNIEYNFDEPRLSALQHTTIQEDLQMKDCAGEYYVQNNVIVSETCTTFISLFYSNAPRRYLHVLSRRQSYCSCSMSTHTLMIFVIITCNYSVDATGTKHS